MYVLLLRNTVLLLRNTVLLLRNTVLLLRNTCTYPYENIFLCKTHPCLLRNQLHCPQSNDLLAPPQGVHPQNLKRGGRLLCGRGVFLRFRLARGGVYSGICSFSLKRGLLGVYSGRSVYYLIKYVLIRGSITVLLRYVPYTSYTRTGNKYS